MNQFIQFILDEQKKQNITDYRIAKILSIDQSNIHRWLKGKSPITLTNYIKICKILKVKKVKFEQDGVTTSFNISSDE